VTAHSLAFAIGPDDELEALVVWDPETGNVIETTTCALEYFLNSGVPLDIVREIGRKFPATQASDDVSRHSFPSWFRDQHDLFPESV